MSIPRRLLPALGTPLLAMLTLSALADRGETSWLEANCDFGTIHEEDGEVSRKVRLVNLGASALTVERAKATCGCTRIGLPDSPVQPGDTASITLTYNPAGRPGRFEKSVKVWTSSDPEPYLVKLRGLVLPTRESLDAAFPAGEGGMRYSSLLIDAGEMAPGKARHFFVSAYNNDTVPHALTLSCPDPWVLVSDKEILVQPGETEPLVVQVAIPLEAKAQEVAFDIRVADNTRGEEETLKIGGRIAAQRAARRDEPD